MTGRPLQSLVLMVSLIFSTIILAHESPALPGGTEKERVLTDSESSLPLNNLQGSQFDHVISDGRNPTCDSAEIWSLRDKISQVKFDSLEKRMAQTLESLDGRVNQKFESLEKRMGQTLESLDRRMNQKFESQEKRMDRWFYRMSKFEDRVSSLQLPVSPVLEPNVTAVLEDVERRLDQIEASKDEQQLGDEAEVCERGMGDDLTKSYRPYIVMSHSSIQRQILCDTQTDGGGWVVIQRRAKGDTDFYRDWSAYREGFGPVTGDHWLGNEAIHKLTDEHPYEIRIDLRIDGQEFYAHYSNFRLESESDKYRLKLGFYSGTIGGTGLTYSNNRPFTTFDRDNDASTKNCAILSHGAWWYGSCFHSNLNGLWGGDSGSDAVRWYTGRDWRYPKFTEMKIRRAKK